jgi:hypothetical protein
MYHTESESLLLKQIRSDLEKTEDIKNTQIRMYQLAVNPNLILTPAQRGLLNWASSQNHLKKNDIANVLTKVLSNTSEEVVKNTHKKENRQNFIVVDQTEYEPLVRKVADSYSWSLIYGNPIHEVQVDLSSYVTPDIAQDQADKFVSELDEGNEKAWITFGLLSLKNRMNVRNLKFDGNNIDLLQIGSNFYLLILSTLPDDFDDDIDEKMNRQTVILTNKIMTFDEWIDPKWVARGVITSFFYVLYRVHDHHMTIPNMIEKLRVFDC